MVGIDFSSEFQRELERTIQQYIQQNFNVVIYKGNYVDSRGDRNIHPTALRIEFTLNGQLLDNVIIKVVEAENIGVVDLDIQRNPYSWDINEKDWELITK